LANGKKMHNVKKVELIDKNGQDECMTILMNDS